jgi:4-hydroxyacetophenone monooxygenase
MAVLVNGKNAETKQSNHVGSYDVDEDFIRKALKEIDINALRMALYQITGDKELEAMRVTQTEMLGGAATDYVLTREDTEVVCNKAVEYFRQGPESKLPPPPSKEEASRLMDLFSDIPLTSPSRQVGFDYDEGYEQLAFEEFPRDVSWTNNTAPDLTGWKVAIVGAGVSGIAAAVALQRLGIPFDIIERQSGFGGTWLLNRYPNVRVDSLGFLYQYKFTKNYKWSEYFPSGGEILAYLEHVAKSFNLKDYCKFNHEVNEAKWDETTSKWNMILKNKDGIETLQYNAVISASGLFSTPNLPDIKGINSYKGPMFHTSQWPDVDYQDRTIAIIGTGSTGTQLAPALATSAKKLTVFQRTPNWIIPLESFKSPVTEHTSWINDNMPYYWHWYCYGNYFKSLDGALVQHRDEEWKKNGGLVNRINDDARKCCVDFIHSKLGDRPDLIAKVTPTSAPFVRRIVVDNGFYDTIKRDNVELVTDGKLPASHSYIES